MRGGWGGGGGKDAEGAGNGWKIVVVLPAFG